MTPMPSYPVPFFWVDAFTDQRFGGNPAGVCLLDGPADERWMQQLAFELGLSETAYLWPDGAHPDGGRPGGGRWSLRWFTPAVEVDLCGHATLAAAQALREAGRAADGDRLSFSTRSGLLAATLGGAVIELDLPAARGRPVDPPAILDAWPVVAAFDGGDDLIVELPDAAAVRSLVPDLAALETVPYRGVVATAVGDGPAGDGADYVLRVFGCGIGIGEDPVTGSAQCTLGPLWAERLGRTVLQAVQLSDRGGRLRVTVAGDRVRVAGGAVTVLRGTVLAGTVLAGTVLGP